MNTLVTDFSRTATLIEVFNPFDVSDQRREIVPLSDCVKVSDLIVADKTHLAVSINGELLDQDQWASREVIEGDYVVLCPVPAGSGGGKSVLRMVALIAIAIAAPYAAVALGGAAAGAVGSLTVLGYGLTVGITIAGSMLVNALMPIDQSLPSGQDLTKDSPSYGIDGAKNTAREGITVPVIYGRYRVAGNLINVFTRNINGGETQDLYSLFALSEGPIGAVLTGTIEVNDQPIENFSDVYSEVRLGDADQALINWFDDVIVPGAVGVTLSTNYHTYTTSSAIDRFRLDIVAPQGWRRIDDKGNSNALNQTLTAQYRKDGTSTWYDIETQANQSGTLPRFTYTHDAAGKKLAANQVSGTLRPNTFNKAGGRIYIVQQYTTSSSTHWKDGGSRFETREVTVGFVQQVPAFTLGVKISGKKTSAYRVSFESTKLIGGRGVYHIRVRRNTAESTDSQVIDTLAWTDLNEIQLQDVRYKYTALLGVKIRLTDQLNSRPNITVEVEGRQIRQPLNNYEPGFEWVERTSSNPAWIVLDMLTNKRYGARYNDDRVDMFGLLQWATYCDANGLEFNGIFDADMNFWDAVTHVFRCGHAKPVPQGMKMGFAIEAADSPTMMFNVSNIKRGSFSLNWLPMSDRANEIEATYYPADNGYKQSALKIVDTQAQQGTEPRIARLNLIGVTNSEQARREAQLMLNMNRYIQQTASWDAPTEAIACKVGDLVLVQHDIPKWSFGGRTEAGSSFGEIRLDREVEIIAGQNYQVLLNFDHLLVSQGTVVSKINNYNLYISETVYREAGAHRLFIGGNEYGVKSIFRAASGFGVTTEEPMTTVIAGEGYDLFRLDALESRPVMTLPGKTKTLVLSSPMPAAAGAYVKWLFGPTEVRAKPFRILSISGSNVEERSISALEYVEEVFTNDTIVSEPPVYILNPELQNVTNLTATQITVASGTTKIPVVRLEWTAPDSYRGADVFVQRDGVSSFLAGSARDGATSFEFADLLLGETLIFRVVASNGVGSRIPVSRAPQVAITITASGTVLAPPTSVTCQYAFEGIRLDFKNSEESNYLETELFHATVNNTGQATRVGRGAQEYFIHTAPGTDNNFYWLRTVNTDKVAGVFTSVQTVEPLPQISNLKLKSAFIGNAAEITWDAISGAVAYQVEVRTKTVLRRSQRVPANEYSYAIQDSIADGDVDRNIEFTVCAISADEKKAPSRNIAVTNPPPALPSDLSVSAGFMMATLEFTPPRDPDYIDTVIWVGTATNFVPSDTNQVAAIAGGPIVITNLEGKTDYYMRLTCRDAWGFGPTSAEYNVRTMDISQFTGLSPWAYVTEVDRQFIEDNLANNAIPSEKIVSITASRITTGTLAATEKISVEGQVESVAGPLVVTMGPKLIDSKVALFSIMNGQTPLLRFNEDGSNEFRGEITITGGTGYANLTDRPARLADISTTDSQRLAAAESEATAAQSTANSKIKTFFQTTQPTTGSAEGDLWYNTATRSLRRKNGSTWVDVGNFVNNTNQLTDGANLGKSAIWATVTGTGRPADNADATNYADARVANAVEAAGVLSVKSPGGGQQSLGGINLTGAIKITLPQSWTATMMYFAVDVYNYATDTSFTLQLGGYNFSGGSWINVSARLIGSVNSDNAVRFGHDGTKCCILIGETNSSWQYTKVTVRDFQAGHSNFQLSQWASGWSIGLVTTLPSNIDATIADALLDARSIKGQGALATRNSADWATQVTGTGKPANGATVGATWSSTLSGIPDRIKDSASLGLNLTADYLGYFDGSAFRSYIQKNGNFHFGSSTNNFLDYNGSQLAIKTTNFEVDPAGNARFKGALTASSFANTKLSIDAAGNLNSSGTFRFGGSANNYVSFDGTRVIINTPKLTLDAAGNATFSGNLNAAGGTFSGTLNVKSAATGGRLQISGDRLEVFDGSNRLRVRIGRL
jgi:predicted phage tail protein